MSRVITQFLIGLGLDDSKFKDGQKKVEESVRGMSRLTAVVGVTAGAGFAALAKNADNTARDMNRARVEADKLGVKLSSLKGFDITVGNITGADATGTTQGLLQGLQEKLTGFQQRGESDWMVSASRSGFNTEGWGQMKDAAQLMDDIVRQIGQASGARKTAMQNEFGFDAGVSAAIDKINKTGKTWSQFVNDFAQSVGITESLNEKSQKYMETLGETQNRLTLLTNTLADRTLPAITALAEGVGKVADIITPFVKELDPNLLIGGAAAGTALAGAGTLKTAGKMLPGVVGRGASALGTGVGALAVPTIGGIAADWGWDNVIMPGSDKMWGKDTTAGGNLKKNSPLGKAWDWLGDAFTPNDRPQVAIPAPAVNPWARDAQADEPVTPMMHQNAYERAADKLFNNLGNGGLSVNSNVSVNAMLNLDGQVLDTYTENFLQREYAIAQMNGENRNV